MSEPKAIDHAAIESLQALAGHGEESTLLNEVVSTFLSSSPPLLHVMRESSKRNDAKSLREAAHSLKSSSALVGASQLSQTCHSIELCTAITPESRALVASAQSHYEAAVSELREIVLQAKSGAG